MANWYQRKPSDDAKLVMLLQLGQVDVVIAALQLSQARCESDGDVVPSCVEPYLEKLSAMGLAASTDETLRFLRMKRKHRGGTTRYPVVPGGTTENHAVPDKKRTEQIREEKSIAPPPESPAPAKPRRKAKAVPHFDSWMPKEEHVAIAASRKLNLAGEHIAMRDWLASTGKTYKDYDAFARNWLRRARPEQQGRAAWIRPGSPLLQKNTTEIPDDDLDYWTRSSNG
jgi:hypothetical protein